MSKVEPPPRRPVVASPEGMALATNIDRRQSTRTVPMKLLCLGVSRTGTASLRQALLDLSYSDVYHYASILNENPRDAGLWNLALSAKFLGEGKKFEKSDWDALLGHCMATTDTPTVMFYRELLSTYPDAKVILTLRDSPRQWWESQSNAIMPFFERVILPEGGWGKWFLPKEGPIDRMGLLLATQAPMYQALLKDRKNGTREAEKWYEAYAAEIQTLVPKEKLLVMNVKEGWKPLCEFLGHEIPPWDFPKVNSTEDMMANIEKIMVSMRRLMLWNMAKTFVPVVSVAVVGVAWWLRR